MKKLTIFLTLSLLTLIGASTVVKAELEQSQAPNDESVILSEQPEELEAPVEDPAAAEYIDNQEQSEVNMQEEETATEVETEVEDQTQEAQ